MPLTVSPQSGEKPLLKYSTWLVLQAIPSPVIYHDMGTEGNSINFGFRWQIIPLNYSFSANKYVSRYQTLFIHPVRRFAGSAEIFLQPELSFSNFNNNRIKNFWFSGGLRVILPLSPYGELFSSSAGIKYNFQKTSEGNADFYAGIEGGLYLMGGLGIQVNYNFHRHNKYNIGLFIKYY